MTIDAEHFEPYFDSHFDPHVLSKLTGVSLRSRHVVEGLLAGEHRSDQTGLAVEFAQLRPYVHGDELRRIDWKVFARTDKLHVRQFVSEVEMTVYAIIDSTASMNYRDYNPLQNNELTRLSKYGYSQILLSVCSWLTLRQNDTFVWGSFGKDTHLSSEYRSVGQWLPFLNQLELRTDQYQLPVGEIPVSQGLNRLLPQFKRKGLVLVFSDLFDDFAALAAALKRIRVAGHDCCVWQVLARDELTFPFDQRMSFTPLENTGSGSTWGSGTQCEPAEIRSAYLEQINTYIALVKQLCASLEIDYRLAVTDRPVDESLSRKQEGIH